MLIIPVIVLAVLVIYIVGVYNGLQTTKTRIRASIQEIGNQLKRQGELIPNLVESAKSYLKHEKDIFAKLTAARKTVEAAVKSGAAQKMIDAQEAVQRVLGSLRVVVESNPQLQAAGIVSDLMSELRDTADKVMYARRTLIDLTADFNRVLATIPSSFVARIFGFKPEKGLKIMEEGEHLEVSKEETKTPKVGL